MRDVVTSADGVPLVYEVHGAGTPGLVFVHGWSCDRSYWNEQVEPFARTFQVVTVDLAGHGESGLGRERWTMGAFGTDVAAVVDALSLERAVLIGHSMGGNVVVEAACRLPGRIEGLIWVDAYRQLASHATPQQVEEALAPFRTDFVPTTRAFVRRAFPSNADETLVERVAADMSAAPPAVALEALESSWSFGRKMTATLQRLDLSVVAINPADPPTDVESMKRHGIEVVLMSGVGHFLMMEDAERFNDLLLAAIEGLARAP